MTALPHATPAQPDVIEERIAFAAKLDAVKPLSTLLSCIANGKKEQFAFFAANETGAVIALGHVEFSITFFIQKADERRARALETHRNLEMFDRGCVWLRHSRARRPATQR